MDRGTSRVLGPRAFFSSPTQLTIPPYDATDVSIHS